MDPEQLYQEVLTEEQQKGSSAPVAEGRAKAARSRAEAGSPHPKEPKWWPGAQPHLEGGDAVAEAPAEEEGEAEAAPEEEPAAEEPAAEEPAAEQEAAPAAAPPAAQPEPAAAPPPAQEPAAAAAPAAAPAATATQTPTPTTGVSHGTATGNRMRPEDGVASPAQLDGQAAMYERRRLIDEVIRTGVPAAAAAERDRSNSGALAILYLLIPLLVIGFLVAAGDGGGESAENETQPAGDEEAAGDSEGTNAIVAADVAFQTDEITAEAGGAVSGTLDNQDTVEHNISFLEGEDGQAFYTSDDAAAGESVPFEFDAPQEPGDYPFLCDYHPSTMTGTLVVGEAAPQGGGGGGSEGGGSGEGGGGGSEGGGGGGGKGGGGSGEGGG